MARSSFFHLLVASILPTSGDASLTASDAGFLLKGFAGNDTLNGNGRSDTLYGAVGDYALYGGTGNDTRDFDNGNDLLNGGPAADTFTLGRFTFHSNDTVRGFATLVDKLIILFQSIEDDTMISDASQQGGNLLVRVCDNTVLMLGTTLAELTPDNVTFGFHG